MSEIIIYFRNIHDVACVTCSDEFILMGATISLMQISHFFLSAIGVLTGNVLHQTDFHH